MNKTPDPFLGRVTFPDGNISIATPSGDEVVLPPPFQAQFNEMDRNTLRMLLYYMYWRGGVPLRLFYGTYQTDDEHDWKLTDPIGSNGVLDPRMDQMPLFIKYNKDGAVSQSSLFDWSTCQDRNCYSWAPTGYNILSLPCFAQQQYCEVVWICRTPDAMVGDMQVGPHFLLHLGSGYYGISLNDLMFLDTLPTYQHGVKEVLALTNWDSTFFEKSVLECLVPSSVTDLKKSENCLT